MPCKPDSAKAGNGDRREPLHTGRNRGQSRAPNSLTELRYALENLLQPRRESVHIHGSPFSPVRLRTLASRQFISSACFLCRSSALIVPPSIQPIRRGLRKVFLTSR